VARKRVAANELVAAYGGGDKAGSKKKLTSGEVQRVVSSIDDAMVQTDNYVRVGVTLNPALFDTLVFS